MILPLRICFSLLAALSLEAGTVSGNIALTAGKGKARRDLSGVVVYLEPADGRVAEVRPRTASMVQKNKTFTPHVLAIPVGSAVEFPNFDPIYHNAFSNYSGQMFDVGLYPPGSSRTIRFRREGIVRVFCNIHPTMSAVIAVLTTPWFAVTDRNGSWQIPEVPSGEYTLRVFHERATDATLAALQRRITVASDVALPAIAISEAGYIPLPHRNKYGREYPPAVNDQLPTYGAHK